MKKGVDPSFNLFERSFLASPLFMNVSGLTYGSLKFVETFVKLCIFINDILIVDDYNITNSIEFVSISNAFWYHVLSTSQSKSINVLKLS